MHSRSGSRAALLCRVLAAPSSLKETSIFKVAGGSTVFHPDPPTEVAADCQRAFAVTLALIVCDRSWSWPIDVPTARIREMIED
jgi:hypothetical protein